MTRRSTGRGSSGSGRGSTTRWVERGAQDAGPDHHADDVLHDAGFTEAGTLWRGGPDAAAVAVR
ncbi:hypothetical protein GCM10010199_71120 [Dactylosporangium roseum]